MAHSYYEHIPTIQATMTTSSSVSWGFVRRRTDSVVPWGAVVVDDARSDVRQFASEVGLVGKRCPPKCDAEHRCADVADGAGYVDARTDGSVADALSKSPLDFFGATLQLIPDALTQRRRRLHRLDGRNEHRQKQVAVLGVDLLYPVEVGEHLLHAAGLRVRIRVQPLDVLVQEGLE